MTVLSQPGQFSAFGNSLPSFFNHDQQQITCFVHGSKIVNCYNAVAEIVGSNLSFVSVVCGLGFIKKYADSGTQTNILCFRSLLPARTQLTGLYKEICQERDSNQHNLFPKAAASMCSTDWAT
jgi:hypothetical protein